MQRSRPLRLEFPVKVGRGPAPSPTRVSIDGGVSTEDGGAKNPSTLSCVPTHVKEWCWCWRWTNDRGVGVDGDPGPSCFEFRVMEGGMVVVPEGEVVVSSGQGSGVVVMRKDPFRLLHDSVLSFP